MTVLSRTADTNDIYLDEFGQISLSGGKSCYAQILKACILTLLGELQLNIDRGIPYLETIFESKMYVTSWKSAVEKTISSFGWVFLIEEFTYSFSGNTLNYSIRVRTEDNEILNINDSINSEITLPTRPNGVNSEMETLIDANGNFYLPDYKQHGVQYYRKMTIVNDSFGVTTELSDNLYVRDSSNNTFVMISE